MKLQIALDVDFTAESAVEYVAGLKDYVDIIEVGTPFVYDCGLEPVRKLKKAYPDKTILADFKIADAGYLEGAMAFKAGADIVTVLGVVDDATILGSIKAAREYGKTVMVDTLGITDLTKRIAELDALGVDYICMHTAKDLQLPGHSDAEIFDSLKKYVKNAKLALAGGICRDNIAKYKEIGPDVIIVGDGITGQSDPAEAAKYISGVMKG